MLHHPRVSAAPRLAHPEGGGAKVGLPLDGILGCSCSGLRRCTVFGLRRVLNRYGIGLRGRVLRNLLLGGRLGRGRCFRGVRLGDKGDSRRLGSSSLDKRLGFGRGF